MSKIYSIKISVENEKPIHLTGYQSKEQAQRKIEQLSLLPGHSSDSYEIVYGQEYPGPWSDENGNIIMGFEEEPDPS